VNLRDAAQSMWNRELSEFRFAAGNSPSGGDVEDSGDQEVVSAYRVLAR
jgi:hypothetical protein